MPDSAFFSAVGLQLGSTGPAIATRDGVAVHSGHQITAQYSFTAPTLVGTKLYLPDDKHIMALDVRAAGLTDSCVRA